MKQYKKYPNRRLYDIENSSYVSLEEIKKSVLAFEEIQVIDSKTNEDITTSTLLQVLNKQDNDNPTNKLVTAKILTNLIRLYEHPLNSLMSPYIESSLEWLQQMNTSQLKSMNVPNINMFQSNQMEADSLQKMQGNYMKMWQDWGKLFAPQAPTSPTSSTTPPNSQDNKSST